MDRLEQLREEFLTAHSNYVWFCGGDEHLTAEDVCTWRSVNHPGEHHQARNKMASTARRYIIARDFNEFDPQRADKLWKLSQP